MYGARQEVFDAHKLQYYAQVEARAYLIETDALRARVHALVSFCLALWVLECFAACTIRLLPFPLDRTLRVLEAVVWAAWVTTTVVVGVIVPAVVSRRGGGGPLGAYERARGASESAYQAIHALLRLRDPEALRARLPELECARVEFRKDAPSLSRRTRLRARYQVSQPDESLGITDATVDDTSDDQIQRWDAQITTRLNSETEAWLCASALDR